jgi:ribosomal protein S18 acetylase RimI-like enzyme
VSCAIELLDDALARAEDNTYEALVAVQDREDGVDPSEEPDRGAGVPMGYACYGPTPMTDASHDLYWLVVAPEARGRGIGRGLLAAVEDDVRRRGGRRIRIETSSLEGEGGAARFYASTGYERVGLIRDFYRPGDDLITFLKVL